MTPEITDYNLTSDYNLDVMQRMDNFEQRVIWHLAAISEHLGIGNKLLQDVKTSTF